MIFGYRVLCLGVAASLFFYPALSSTGLAEVGSTIEKIESVTSYTHRVPDHFVSGHRIELTAGIRDKEGIDLARCYFKASEQADFVFVEMTGVKGDDYRAILPAPAEGTARIDYFFLAKNQAGAVTRTQEFYLFRSEREEVPGWQEVDAEEPLTVKTELAEAPEELAGFSDSIEMDTVESAARLVVVAGGVGGITMVTAGSGGGTILGMSVTTAAIVGGGAAAAGAGAAVAASSGSGGGSSSNGDDNDSLVDIVGSWVGTDSLGGKITVTFYADGTLVGRRIGGENPEPQHGTYLLEGNKLRTEAYGTAGRTVFNGIVSGNTITGRWDQWNNKGEYYYTNMTLTRQ